MHPVPPRYPWLSHRPSFMTDILYSDAACPGLHGEAITTQSFLTTKEVKAGVKKLHFCPRRCCALRKPTENILMFMFNTCALIFKYIYGGVEQRYVHNDQMFVSVLKSALRKLFSDWSQRSLCGVINFYSSWRRTSWEVVLTARLSLLLQSMLDFTTGPCATII